MKEVKLYLGHAGFCYAKESHAIRGGEKKQIKFKALFGLIRHDKLGWILFDTGYTKRFYEATKHFPNSIYAQVTKVLIEPGQEVKEQIKQLGLTCADIKHVIISHFHADHIGGLKDFEEATFYCSKLAYRQAKNISKRLAFTKGILKDLIPDDIEKRLKFIEDAGAPVADDIFGVKYDLFHDQSVFTCNLPGHAEGQIGIELQTKSHSYFLIADACWHKSAFEQLVLPSPVVRLFFSSWKQYKAGINKIHQYHKKFPLVTIVPTHCNETTAALIPDSNRLHEV